LAFRVPEKGEVGAERHHREGERNHRKGVRYQQPEHIFLERGKERVENGKGR
jgi:hypothetical protein